MVVQLMSEALYKVGILSNCVGLEELCPGLGLTDYTTREIQSANPTFTSTETGVETFSMPSSEQDVSGSSKL